jgi:hypothetical protein
MESDLADLDRLGQMAISAAAAAVSRAASGKMSARGLDPIALARAALDKAVAAAEAVHQSAGPNSALSGDDSDSARSLRLTLLQHVFPDAAASAAGIPPAAAHAPVSYFSSSSGVAFLLGACLGVFLDLRGDRYMKLFLTCRQFRYELLVAPGVPATRKDMEAVEATAERTF